MSTLTTATPQTVRILGIDPGLQTTGFGVLDMTGSIVTRAPSPIGLG